MGFADLHPPPLDTVPRPERSGCPSAIGSAVLRASLSQAVHSDAMMRRMLVSLRKPVMRRSSTLSSPSLFAPRTAFRKVVSATPTIAARWPTASRQSPRLVVSAATSASTACSARVNRAASAGGSRPEAAQRRRRSSDASVRGREPTALLGAATRSWRVSPAPPTCDAAGIGTLLRRGFEAASGRASISLDRPSASASVSFPSP